jgi:hypothetical protein
MAGKGDSYGAAMDEAAPTYSDPFPLLMTHPRHGGIFTPWERRKSFRIEPVAPHAC